MKQVLSRLGRALRVVIHDPGVQRTGKQLALLVIVRLLIALGASAQVVEIVRQLAG